MLLADAFEALKSYDWGTDMAVLAPIEDASTKTASDAGVRTELEKSLVAALEGSLSRDAQDYVCRKLATVGSTAAVPVLAAMLVKEESSHMARFALERIPSAEAGKALRDALAKTSGNLKIGIISSLGSRRDGESIKALGSLLADSAASISKAAAMALGAIGTVDASKALQGGLSSVNSGHHAPIQDALFRCAETLLAGSSRADAQAIYQSLNHDNQPRLIRLAATRGLLACASKQV